MLLPLLAVLLTACSSGAASTPAASVPVTAPAVTGTGTAAASGAATVVQATPAATSPSVEPATRVPATGPATQATPVPTLVPTPRPTPTQRAATPTPATGEQAPRGGVSISNFAFVPATITVKVGTRVTWTNRQAGVQHTVTAGDGSFGSAALSTGSSYSYVFTRAGTFTYHCAIHPFMTGTVIVIG